MLEAPRRLGSVSFQSKDVRGAQNSEFLFCKWMREGGRERIDKLLRWPQVT
jgi:hypothetical protein